MDTKIAILPASEADARIITETSVASHRSAYKDIIPAKILDSLDASDPGSWIDTIRKFPDNVLIARDETGQILGFSCAGPIVHPEKNAGFEGQIYGLHVKPGFNGQGIGSLLLAASLHSMKLRGLSSAIVWTFKANMPAINFYSKHGATFIKESPMDYRGLSLIEVAYGWKQLN